MGEKRTVMAGSTSHSLLQMFDGKDFMGPSIETGMQKHYRGRPGFLSLLECFCWNREIGERLQRQAELKMTGRISRRYGLPMAAPPCCASLAIR
jgi:hypothetical protein